MLGQVSLEALYFYILLGCALLAVLLFIFGDIFSLILNIIKSKYTKMLRGIRETVKEVT